MEKEFICIKRVFLGILREVEKGHKKGEHILPGTSMVIVSKDKLRKKNGTRIYEIDGNINKETFKYFFIELKRYKYIGNGDKFKKNKKYIFGGMNYRNGNVRLFDKRFPEADFIELDMEDFMKYFEEVK